MGGEFGFEDREVAASGGVTVYIIAAGTCYTCKIGNLKILGRA